MVGEKLGRGIRDKVSTFIFFDSAVLFTKTLDVWCEGKLGQVDYRHLCIDHLLCPYYFFALVLNLSKCNLNKIYCLPPKEFW